MCTTRCAWPPTTSRIPAGTKQGHHLPAPQHYDHHESAAHYLDHYITNNYTTIIEHNTNIDDSVHQNIDTHGGDFHQVIDNDPVVASGDGAVASGGDIQGSTVTTGSGNVVGDDNHATTGDDNTTAFGSGDATNANLHDVHTGSGSGLSFGGDATGHATDNATNTTVHSSGSGDTSVAAAGAHADASQYADQSEHDNATHSAYDDDSRTSEHNTYDSTTPTTTPTATTTILDGPVLARTDSGSGPLLARIRIRRWSTLLRVIVIGAGVLGSAVG